MDRSEFVNKHKLSVLALFLSALTWLLMSFLSTPYEMRGTSGIIYFISWLIFAFGIIVIGYRLLWLFTFKVAVEKPLFRWGVIIYLILTGLFGTIGLAYIHLLIFIYEYSGFPLDLYPLIIVGLISSLVFLFLGISLLRKK